MSAERNGSAAPVMVIGLGRFGTAVARSLARMGHVIAPAQGRVSHWSPYLRPGVFSVYRALLSGDLMPDSLPKPRPTRRWSRLVALRPMGRAFALK